VKKLTAIFALIFISCSAPLYAQDIPCSANIAREDLDNIKQFQQDIVKSSIRAEASEQSGTGTHNIYYLKGLTKTWLKEISRQTLEAIFYYEDFQFYRGHISDSKNPEQKRRRLLHLCSRAQRRADAPKEAIEAFANDLTYIRATGLQDEVLDKSALKRLIIALTTAIDKAEESNLAQQDFLRRASCLGQKNIFSNLEATIEKLQNSLTEANTYLTEQTTGLNCCICEYQDSNDYEEHFYKAGCKLWLRERTSCDIARTAAIEENMAAPLNLPGGCIKGNLELGYVGHWNADRTENYLTNRLIPTAKYYRTPIRWDNTACSVLKNADDVQELLQSQSLPKGVDIEVTGSQCISTGAWDRIITPPNIKCKVGSNCKIPEFPLCANYQDKKCSKYQKNQSATCLDESEAKVTLTCCSNPSAIKDKLNIDVLKSWYWRSNACTP
jgi:hypothetical protein